MGRRRDRAQRSCAGPAGLSRGVNLVTICVKRKPKELLWTLPQSECFALKKKKKKERKHRTNGKHYQEKQNCVYRNVPTVFENLTGNDLSA